MPIAALWLVCGCGRNETTPDSGVESPETGPSKPIVAEHLGFATRVPGDCDFYFSAFYDGEELLESMMELLLASGLGELREEEGEVREQAGSAFAMMGTEMFVFVGEGAGDQLKLIGTTYRELSAAWAGMAIRTMLGVFADGDARPDFEALGEGLVRRLSEEWLAALEKDSQLRVPSVVAGWKPHEEKLEECRQAVEQWLAEIFPEDENVALVEFERHGIALKGHRIEGIDVFREWIEMLGRTAEERTDVGEFYSAERLEQLMAALRNLRFTIAAGAGDGRVMIYFGNGEDGFKLADDPGESLAAKEELRWMEQAPGRSIRCAAYVSEPMVAALLPWLDTSSYWSSLADAVGPPLREQEMFRRLLTGLAGVTRKLGERRISAWSAFVYTDPAWVVETWGGMVDPSIDYETPLTMWNAATKANPAFRAHWVQDRGWNDLSWSKTEHFGALLELGLREWGMISQEDALSLVPEGFMERLASEIIALNRMYRDEIRKGIGDEVAVFGDFLGEMPAVPGVSQEVIQEQTIPRFLIARPLSDREKITAAGMSVEQGVRRVSAWLGDSVGINIPAILPQSIESGGMVTWYPPVPFIGGDFVPGVSIDDKVWLLGTSRSMARGFSKAMSDVNSAGETGVIIELDLERLVGWVRQVGEANAEKVQAIMQEMRDDGGVSGGLGSREGIPDVFNRLGTFSYRGWLESGTPRALYSLGFIDDR